jgi:hypothetical protein
MYRSHITLIYSRTDKTQDMVAARQLSKLFLNVISDFDYDDFDNSYGCPTVSFYAESPSCDDLYPFEQRLAKINVDYALQDIDDDE